MLVETSVFSVIGESIGEELERAFGECDISILEAKHMCQLCLYKLDRQSRYNETLSIMEGVTYETLNEGVFDAIKTLITKMFKAFRELIQKVFDTIFSKVEDKVENMGPITLDGPDGDDDDYDEPEPEPKENIGRSNEPGSSYGASDTHAAAEKYVKIGIKSFKGIDTKELTKLGGYVKSIEKALTDMFDISLEGFENCAEADLIMAVLGMGTERNSGAFAVTVRDKYKSECIDKIAIPTAKKRQTGLIATINVMRPMYQLAYAKGGEVTYTLKSKTDGIVADIGKMKSDLDRVKGCDLKTSEFADAWRDTVAAVKEGGKREIATEYFICNDAQSVDKYMDELNECDKALNEAIKALKEAKKIQKTLDATLKSMEGKVQNRMNSYLNENNLRSQLTAIVQRNDSRVDRYALKDEIDKLIASREVTNKLTSSSTSVLTDFSSQMRMVIQRITGDCTLIVGSLISTMQEIRKFNRSRQKASNKALRSIKAK